MHIRNQNDSHYTEELQTKRSDDSPTKDRYAKTAIYITINVYANRVVGKPSLAQL